MQNSQQNQRSNQVFRSLHRPLTYFGVERGVFFTVCVLAVTTMDLFDSVLAGVMVFSSGYVFGRWLTKTDPAMLQILVRSQRFRLLYDALKQEVSKVEVR